VRQEPTATPAGIQETDQDTPCQASTPTAPVTVSRAEYRNSKRLIPDDLIQQSLNEKFALGELEIVRGPKGESMLRDHRTNTVKQRVRCRRPDIGPWLMTYTEEAFGALLSPEQKTQFTDWIIGKGRVQLPHDIKTDHELQSLECSPTIMSIVEYMRNQTGQVKESAAALWEILRNIADRGKFLRLGGQSFPRSASAFTRRLNQEKADLDTLGIDVEVVRSNGAQVVLTKREGIDVDMPPERNPSTGKDLSTEQTARALDKLLEKRHRQAFDGSVSLVNEGAQK